MVNPFKINFQANHDKMGLGFNVSKYFALEEEFANLNIHDRSFNINDIGLYFGPSNLVLSYYSITLDFFNETLS